MTGVVLCGGQSTRMQSDKGLLKMKNITWAQTAVNKLDGFKIPVFVSINPYQYEEYKEIIAPALLMQDAGNIPVKGPLLALLSAHQFMPGEDLLVLACDMLLMEPFIIRELISAYHHNPESEAFLFTNNGEFEPLCAIYTAPALSDILRKLLHGELKKYSMKHALDQLKVFSIEIPPAHESFFANFNAHADLNGL